MSSSLVIFLLLSIVACFQGRLNNSRSLSEAPDPLRFRAVKLLNDVESSKAGIYLIIFNRTIHKLEDEKTLSTLDIDVGSVEPVTLLPNQYVLKGSIAPIVYNKRDADDIMRVEVLKSQLLMGQLLSNMIDIGGYINPSLAIFRGRLLLATGVAWTLSGMNDGLPASDMVHIKWLNSSRYPFYSDAPFLGVGTKLQPIKSTSNPPEDVLGQDPRIVLFQDKLHFTFTNRHIRPHLRLGMAELGVHGSSETVQTEKYFFQVTFDSPRPQKNWVPFVHHNELLFLSQINPLEVVRVRQEEGGNGGAQVIAGAPHVETRWQYGEIRGGTNAIQIDEHRLVSCLIYSFIVVFVVDHIYVCCKAPGDISFVHAAARQLYGDLLHGRVRVQHTGWQLSATVHLTTTHHGGRVILWALAPLPQSPH